MSDGDEFSGESRLKIYNSHLSSPRSQVCASVPDSRAQTMDETNIGSIGSIPVRATSRMALETSTVGFVVSDPAPQPPQTAGALG